MTASTDDAAASSRLAAGAREAVRRGPGPPPPGAGRLRRALRRAVLRLLRPYTAQQQAIDERIIDAIDELDRRAGERDRLELDLLVEDFAAALESLRARVAAGEDVIAGSRAVPYAADGVLERFRAPVGGTVLGYREAAGATGRTYLDFEQVFRGPEERVRERQRVYVELLSEHAPVLDAGCGRGELLDLLTERGVACMGVDLDEGMVEHCRAKGHDVQLGDANAYLESLDDEALGGVFSAQVIEHLPYRELLRFFRGSLAKLRAGGLFVAETVNPHAPHALKTFWVDPTHQHPVFPEVALVLCRAVGFDSAYVFHPLGSGHVDQDRYVESEYAVVARKA
jgi:SAM-dependent methyltransferase